MPNSGAQREDASNASPAVSLYSHRPTTNFVGLTPIGSTKSVQGVFQFLDTICCCADWGTKEFQTWINEQVLSEYCDLSVLVAE